MKRYLTGRNAIMVAIVVIALLLAWSLYKSRKKTPATSTLTSTGNALAFLGQIPGLNLDVSST